jgi:TP901 family phage tail tape measure protein
VKKGVSVLSDSLKILIQGLLDVDNTQSSINTQLKSLQSKIDKVKIEFDIDDKVLKTLGDFSKAMEKHKEISKDLNKVMREEKTITKEANGVIKEKITQHLKSGEIIEKEIERINKKNKATKEQIDAEEKYLDVLEKSGQLQKRRIRENAKGVTGSTEKYKDGYTDVTYKLNKDGNAISKETVINRDKETNATQKLKDKQDELLRKLKQLQVQGDITSKTFEKMTGAVNTRQSVQQLDRLNDSMNVLQRNSKRKSIVGENIGANEGLKELKNANEKLLIETLRANKAIGDQRIIASSVDRVTGKWNVTVKENARQQRTLSGVIDKSTGSLYKQKEALSDVASRNLGMFEQMKIAMSRVPIWAGAMTAFYGTAAAGTDMIQNLLMIDQQMTELKRVMDSGTNFTQMLEDSVQMSKELGRNLQDVNNAIILAAKTGANASDSLALAETSVIASNISELTAEEAMNNLITVTTQFNLAASESIDVINKLNEVDNNFATSTKDLSDSLARAGSVAKTYNISLDEMIGYTTAMQVATRASGAEVGNAMKTIVSRLSSNDSLTALREVGIQIDDISNGSEILQKIGMKWNTLTDAQKQNLGVTIAGRWQLAKFLGLFNNYQMSLDATETSLNSQNSAIKENEKYLQSMEARINTLKNSWIEFSIAMGNSGVSDIFGGIIIGLTKLAESGTAFVEQFGSLPAIFALATGGLLLFSNTFRSWATTTKGVNTVQDVLANTMQRVRDHSTATTQLIQTQTKDMKGLQKATVASSVAWNTLGASMRAALMSTGVGIAVVGLSYAIGHLTTKFIEQKREQRELERTNKEVAKSYATNKEEIDELVASYESLKAKQSNSSLNADEDKQLTETQNKLNELLPVLTKNIDEKGNAHLRNVDAIKQEIKFAGQLADNYKKESNAKIDGNIDDTLKKIKDAENQLKDLRSNKTNTSRHSIVGNLPETELEAIAKGREMLELEREIETQREKLIKLTQDKVKYYGELEKSTENLTKEDQQYLQTQIEKSKANITDLESVDKVANKYADLQKILNELRGLGGDKISVGFVEGLSEEKTQALERFLSLTKEFNGDMTYFTRYLTEAGFTQSEVLMIVNDLKNGISDQSKEVNNAAKSYDNFKNSMSDTKSVMEGVNNVLGIGVTSDDIDNLRTLVNTMELLENQSARTAEQEEYLANAQKYLAETYPHLADGTNIRLDAVKQEIRAGDILLEATQKLANGQMSFEEAKTIATATEANARVQIMSKELQALQKMLNEYAKAEASIDGAIASNGRIMSIYNKMVTIETDLKIEIPNRNKLVNQVGELIDYTDDFTKSNDKNSKSQKNQIYITDKYKTAIEELNTELSKLKELQSDYPKWSEEYQDSLKKEIALIEKKKKLTNDQAYTLGQQIKTGKIKPTGMIDLGGSSSSVAVSSSSFSKATGSSNMDIIWNFFKSKGFSDAIVAGIMGNLQLESGFSPTALNKSSGAFGLAQWLGGRKTALSSFAKSSGTSMSDIHTQLNFLWKELNSTEKRTMNYLNANQGASASEIAAAFDKLFERSEGTHIPTRQSYANQILAQFGGKGAVAVSTSSKSSSSGNNSKADMAQAVDQAKSDYQGLLQDIYSLEEQIQQLRFQLVEAQLAEWEHKIERANVLLEAHSIKLAKLDPLSQAYTDELGKQLNTLQWQQKSQNELAWRTEYYAKKAKGLTQEQREALMDRYYVEINALNEIRNQIEEIEKQIRTSEIERITDKLAKVTENLSDRRDGVSRQANRIDEDDPERNKKLIGFYQEQIILAGQEKKEIQNTINTLAAKRTEMQKAGEDVSFINEQIEELQDNLTAIDDTEFDLKENLKDVFEGMADEVIDAYKEYYEQKYELDKQAIEDELEAFKKSHDEKMELLDDELEKYQDIINAKLESIDRQESEDDHNKEVAKRQEEIQKTQNQINILGMDDSREAQAKRSKLQEELEQQQLDLAELVHDREVELRKQNLQDELKTKEEAISAEKEKNETELEEFEQLQEDKLEVVDQAFEDLINNEQYWADLRKQILAGNIEGMTEQLASFVTTIKGSMEEIGTSISNNLIEKLEKAGEMLETIESGGSYEDVVTKPTTGNKPQKLTEADMQLMASKFIESEILPGVKDKNVKDGLQGRIDGLEKSAISNGTLLDTNASFDTLMESFSETEKVLFSKYIRDVVAKGINTTSVKDKMFDITDVIIEAARKSGIDPKLWWNIPFLQALTDYQSFDTGGMTKGDGFAMLHDKEIVLNRVDTTNILEAVKITRNFADIFKNFKLPSITPNLAGAGGGINVNVHIDNMNGTRKDAENVFTVVANKLRGLGVK